MIYSNTKNNVIQDLPQFCFATDPENGDLIKIEKSDGIYLMCVQFKTRNLNQNKADKLNDQLGVTKRQVAAMLHGALSGWDSKPKTYTVSGKEFKKLKI